MTGKTLFSRFVSRSIVLTLLVSAADLPAEDGDGDPAARLVAWANDFTAGPDPAKLKRLPRAKIAVLARVLKFDPPADPAEFYALSVEFAGFDGLQGATLKTSVRLPLNKRSLRDLAEGQTIAISGRLAIVPDGIPATIGRRGFQVVGGRPDPPAAIFSFSQRDGGPRLVVAVRDPVVTIRDADPAE